MRKEIVLLPLLSLGLCFFHDALLTLSFRKELPECIRMVEANLDDEKRGGQGLPSTIRFIDTDDRKTPFIQEYSLMLVSPYVLKKGYPTKQFCYYRNQDKKRV